MRKFPLVLILTSVVVVVACSCRKNRDQYFPNVGFEEYVYLNNPSSQPLQNVSGYVYHSGGYKGLIIFRRNYNPTDPTNDFIAFDRACPEHYDEECGLLQVDANGTFAECSCNDEQYLLYDGSPGRNASWPLRQYRVSYNGNVLVISN